MDMFECKISGFFASNNFDTLGPSIESTTKAFLFDAYSGLENDKLEYTQEMLPTWIQITPPTDKTVIVLDAGGTNFRSYLVKLENGKAKILESKKGSIPGSKGELTKEQFFSSIADSIEYLKDKAESIHFCFAYAINMTSEKDATVLRMSKEINVKGILNELVGASLLKTLKDRGWKNIQNVFVLNDTVAALLSGLSLNKPFSSYIGLILGTGLNIAYIESSDIPKLPVEQKLLPQIIVCETAKTNKIVASDFDKILHTQVSDGDICKCEKMCSGAYLGKLISICLVKACEQGLFSKNFAQSLKPHEFSFQDINEVLTGEVSAENQLALLCKDATAEDIKTINRIAGEILNRVARIVASALSAIAIKSGAGKDKQHPICIVAEGTTFKKAFNLKQQIQKLLTENLTQKHQIYFELVEVEEAIVLGSAYF